jgi:hypothetical protein
MRIGWLETSLEPAIFYDIRRGVATKTQVMRRVILAATQMVW